MMYEFLSFSKINIMHVMRISPQSEGHASLNLSASAACPLAFKSDILVPNIY